MYRFCLYYPVNQMLGFLVHGLFVAAFNVAKSGYQNLEKFASVAFVFFMQWMYRLAFHGPIQIPAPVTCTVWPFLSRSLTTPLCPYQLPGTSFYLYLLLLSHHFRLFLTNPRASPGIFSLVLVPVSWLLTWFVVIVHTQAQVHCSVSLFSSEVILCLS